MIDRGCVYHGSVTPIPVQEPAALDRAIRRLTAHSFARSPIELVRQAESVHIPELLR